MNTVLIADDYEDTVECTSLVLAQHGYSVVIAYDGIEALKVANEIRPKSIILDLALPELDGYEVARTLRQSNTFLETKFIAFSGHVDQSYRDRATAAGFDFYLPKPADPDILLACLQANLNTVKLIE
jgi:CheY-like chemotaxis protein